MIIGMMFLKLLLNGGLIFISAAVLYASNNTEKDSSLAVKDRLQIYVRPDRYYVHLEVKKVARDNIVFLSTCKINLYINDPTNYITLHAPNSNISEELINLEWADMHTVHKPKNYTYNNESHILTLDFDKILLPGLYFLKMPTFVISADDDSFFKTSLNSLETVVTRFEVFGTRRVFPCWDELEFRSVFYFEIKHNNNYWALTNKPEAYSEADTTITLFDVTPVMTTYDIAFMVSNYTFNPKATNFRCRSDVDKHITFADNVALNVTFYLDKYWKGMRKISRANHVAIPGFLYNSIQHQGIIFYKEADVVYDETLDPVARKIEVARLVGRKVIHEWLENIVEQPYSWLNEAFAIFFGTYAVNKVYPQFGMMDLFIIQIQHDSFRLASIMKSSASKDYNTFEINSFFAYVRASATLRMLQYGITEEVFQKGIQKFVEKFDVKFHEFNTLSWATLNDLWSAIQFVNDEAQIYESKNLNILKLLDLWTTQESYPVLKITRHYDNNMSITQVWLENYDAYQGAQWSHDKWIPLTYATQKFANFNRTLPFWVKVPKTSAYRHLLFTLSHNSDDDDGWIIINLQQIGYYRVNYDDEIWRKIVSYLNSEEYIKIHVLNRAQIIDDAFHFLLANELDYSIFLSLLESNYLRQETNYVAWYPMFKALEYISCFFPYLENTYIKVCLQDILRNLLKNIGYEEQLHEDDFKKCLRQEAARWACILGDVICKTYATNNLIKHLEYPETQKILPWWKEWTFCNGLANQFDISVNLSNSIILSTLDVWVKTSDIKILEFLSCSVELHQINNYLDVILNDPKNCILTKSNCTDARIEVKERVNSFLLTVKRHANNYKALDYIMNNFEKIKPKEISMITALISIINHIYIEDQLDKVMSFTEDVLHKEQLILISSISIKFFKKLSRNMYFFNQILGKTMNMITSKFVASFKNKIKKRLFQIANQRNYWSFIENRKKSILSN